ncbi:hypothetical protein J4413_01730 [Candidatus Woesearchaeota archaeon]|nr:hypothetical protein [Candidatus Woesearchaeota archaeon]
MIKKVFKDKEKVKSLLKLIEEREKFLELDIKFPTIIVETYYEIIKELSVASLLLDGLKAIGEDAHKEMLDYLINYNEFSASDVVLLQDLRKKRNKSMYEGKQIEPNYLENKEQNFKKIISKLKNNIKTRL